ncbi:MAG: FtsX-like permease family protein [Candidatus Omnitrophica bacterium]|nr:FtsX-like permease family protein [Candidatus Omnitrophota bacterium]MBU0878547.1 FtsX-like permease family protein [Candidatus Omnitrophota bacterium]MBU1367591.1 FtsX-like permease family protein [Candidatus Omnitrophota bacterium]MBU1810688.1 FtsX-like permease family protein [Candidatus Omnitrophota bacterium]MBU2437229.1 FtsX-like permease family protein [Candidatus Omnitrophota bacterium]
MITWIKIGIRNLYKNKRRSLFTIGAISLGFAAVNIFGGFTNYMYTNLKQSFIYGQGNGHLTVFKKGFSGEGKIDPLKYLIAEAEMKTIRGFCMKDSRVLMVTPQLRISGLLSNGEVSTIFIAGGRVPSEIRFINSQAKGLLSENKFFEGKQLEDNITYGVGLSKGLAKKLGLSLNSGAIAMSPTVEGLLNALDAQVFQLFDSPAETLDDKLMIVPLKFAQLLYDTSSVDRLTVLLDDDKHIESVKAFLEQGLKQKGLAVEIKQWRELSSFYKKTKDMFDTIFIFIFVIVFIIVVMSIINTISMAVMERTREVGTLRTLGVKRKRIIELFAIESGLLGIMGSIIGMLLTLAIWIGIQIWEPTWIPPHITIRVPLEVYLVPGYIILSFLCLVVLSVVAAAFPARKAAHMSIVDALGHV